MRRIRSSFASVYSKGDQLVLCPDKECPEGDMPSPSGRFSRSTVSEKS